MSAPTPEFFEHVNALWEPIIRRAKDGEDVAREVAEISAYIAQQEAAANSQQLAIGIPHPVEIRAARMLHDNYEKWLVQQNQQITNWNDYWANRSRIMNEFTLKLASDGLKYVLILHGATAIACLNSLTSEHARPYKDALLTAMFGAFVGILMLVIGIIILMKNYMHQVSTVQGRLTRRQGWRGLGAIGRWLDLRAQKNTLRAVDSFTYGSLIVFALYVFVAFVLIWNT